MLLASLVLALGLPSPGLEGPVKWHRSIEEAREAAWREGKLLFVYQLVGELDREKC